MSKFNKPIDGAGYVKCENCDGDGLVDVTGKDGVQCLKNCPICEGRGEVWDEKITDENDR